MVSFTQRGTTARETLVYNAIIDCATLLPLATIIGVVISIRFTHRKRAWEMVAWIRGTYVIELQSLIVLWTVAATAPPGTSQVTAFIQAIRISPGWTVVCASLLEVLVLWYWIEARRRARGQQYLMELADKDPDGIVAAFLDDGRIHAVQETHDSLTITRCGLRRDVYRNEPPPGQSAGTPPICGPCLDKLYAEWKRNRRSGQ